MERETTAWTSIDDNGGARRKNQKKVKNSNALLFPRSPARCSLLGLGGAAMQRHRCLAAGEGALPLSFSSRRRTQPSAVAAPSKTQSVRARSSRTRSSTQQPPRRRLVWLLTSSSCSLRAGVRRVHRRQQCAWCLCYPPDTRLMRTLSCTHGARKSGATSATRHQPHTATSTPAGSSRTGSCRSVWAF